MSDDISFLRRTVHLVMNFGLKLSCEKYTKLVRLISFLSLCSTLTLSILHILKKLIWIYRSMPFTSLVLDILTDLPYFYWDILLFYIRSKKSGEFKKLLVSLEQFDKKLMKKYSVYQNLALYMFLSLVMFASSAYKIRIQTLKKESSYIMMQIATQIASYYMISLAIQLLHCFGNRYSSLAHFIKMRRKEGIASDSILKVAIEYSKILYEATILFNSIFKLYLFFMVFTIIIYMMRVLDELILKVESFSNALIDVSINFLLFLVSIDY